MRASPRGSRAHSLALVAAILTAPLTAHAGPDPGPSTAFFYGRDLPIEALSSFDRVVVEPRNVTDEEMVALTAAGVELFAYVSVGEVEKGHALEAKLRDDWRLGENAAWKSVIVDPAKAGWRQMLLNWMQRLRTRGFSAFFFDTMDSYEAVLPVSAQAPRVTALLRLLRDVQSRFPGTKLITNRGFALFPEAAPLVAGVVAESLFSSWNAQSKKYEPVSAAGREWLLARLRPIAARHKVPVTIIDYVPFTERDEARAVARKIVAQGFVPYVGVPSLDTMGIGLVEPVPRRVLLVYDGGALPLASSPAHRLAALPLEHLGYAIDYADARGTLPGGRLVDRYAGLVTWFGSDDLPEPARFRDWLTRQMDQGLRIAVMGRLGFAPDGSFLDRLGLAHGDSLKTPVRMVRADALVGFEASASPLGRGVYPWRATAPATTAHVELMDSHGARACPVVTAVWGGLALDPYVLEQGFEGHRRWILDPFAFFTRALALAPMPALDVTTENGRRLMTVHIDGDGFAEIAQGPRKSFAAQVLHDEIIRSQHFPTTISLVQNDVAPAGAHPEASARLEALARTIFRLPHVEAASHGQRHPARGDTAPLDGGQEIEVPVYYMNGRLVAPGRPVRLVAWPGAAVPTEEALRLARALGLVTIAGEQIEAAHSPSMTVQPPLGRPVGREYLVYEPAQGDLIYTNLWRGPFYGYRRVVDTFVETDRPRRLKPIGIYYHFLSGSRTAALRALSDVYQWAQGQDTLPLFVSQYARKAEEFHRATVARRLDGAWEWKGLDTLRTVRLAPQKGWPDLARSEGVVGVTELPQGRYVALAPAARVRLYLTDVIPQEPHLAWANAAVANWTPDGKTISFRLAGHQPVKMGVAGCAQASLVTAGGPVRPRLERGVWVMDFGGTDTGDAKLRCQ